MKEIEKIFEKINEKIKAMSFFKFYALTLTVHFVWSFLIGTLLYLSGVSFSQNVASSSDFVNSFLLVPFCALAEELLFRWAPMIFVSVLLILLQKINVITDKNYHAVAKYIITVFVIISSIIFGYVHGNVFNILLQGVSGIIFFTIYLRTLAIRIDNGKKDKLQIVPLFASTVYHSVSNIILVFLWFTNLKAEIVSKSQLFPWKLLKM